MYFRISKFQPQPELWQEIEKVTAALRAESDTNDSEKQFLCEMFRHISAGKLFQATEKKYLRGLCCNITIFILCFIL